MSIAAVVNLIRTEQLVPATLAARTGPGLRVTIAAWASDLDISGPIYGCGPYKAQLQLDESDVKALAPYREACDISGWQQQARATARAVEKFERVLPPYIRVTSRDGILTFVWVR